MDDIEANLYWACMAILLVGLAAVFLLGAAISL